MGDGGRGGGMWVMVRGVEVWGVKDKKSITSQIITSCHFCSYSDQRQSSVRRFIQDERATVQEIICVSHMICRLYT